MVLWNRWLKLSVAIVVLGLTCPLSSAGADETALPPQAKLAAPGPEAGGLASLYPGDENIERDPRVLFVDDFETGAVDDIAKRWGHADNRQNIDLADDVHAKSPGSHSLHMSRIANLFTHTRGVDTMYARFYVKFHPNIGSIHHFVQLCAWRIPRVYPQGTANRIPVGDDFFTTTIEPGDIRNEIKPPGLWHFYTYWHNMRNGWGTVYRPQRVPIDPGRWYCVEVMLKANSAPDKSDGEQALWVDGELRGRFGDFNWRTTDKLKINSFWLLFYNSGQQPDRTMEVWFDDIVLATEYVGPVQGAPRAGKKKAVPSQSALLTPGLIWPEPGKVIYTQKFEAPAPNFKGQGEGGEIIDAGVDGSKAFSFGPKGFTVSNEFSTPVVESTTIRFKLKPLVRPRQVAVMLRSKKLNDNCRCNVGYLRQDQWNQVELRAMECRTGGSPRGAGMEGSILENLSVLFDGAPTDRFLIDDIEICQ